MKTIKTENFNCGLEDDFELKLITERPELIYGIGYKGLERYMVHKNKRIDKKWEKRKDFYKLVSYNPQQFIL